MENASKRQVVTVEARLEMQSEAVMKKRMEELDNAKTYFEDSVLILGFLGGVSLATLVLLLQEKTTIESMTRVWIFPPSAYFQFVVGFLGCVSAICVIACNLCQRCAARWIRENSLSWNSAYWLHNIAYLTFCAALVLVVLPFAFWAGVAVLLVGSVLGLFTIVIPYCMGDTLPRQIRPTSLPQTQGRPPPPEASSQSGSQ